MTLTVVIAEDEEPSREHLRELAAAFSDLHVVGGTASRRTRARSKSSFLDRLEERWRQRPEGHR